MENNEEKTKAEQPEDIGKGNKPEATEVIKAANDAAERMEIATKRKAEILDREEQLMATARLSGRSEAGEIAKPETAEEKWQKDAKERYKGTGMDPTPDDAPTTYS